MSTHTDTIRVAVGSPLCWAIEGKLLIILAGSDPIDGHLFSRFLKDIQTHEWTKCLGGSIGSLQITSTQRRDIAREFRGKKTAALADHAVARGVATALSWLGIDIAAWSWADISKALVHLELDASEQEAAVVLMNLLKEKQGAS